MAAGPSLQAESRQAIHLELGLPPEGRPPAML
jgi:hypothetical protein